MNDVFFLRYINTRKIEICLKGVKQRKNKAERQ